MPFFGGPRVRGGGESFLASAPLGGGGAPAAPSALAPGGPVGPGGLLLPTGGNVLPVSVGDVLPGGPGGPPPERPPPDGLTAGAPGGGDALRAEALGEPPALGASEAASFLAPGGPNALPSGGPPPAFEIEGLGEAAADLGAAGGAPDLAASAAGPLEETVPLLGGGS